MRLPSSLKSHASSLLLAFLLPGLCLGEERPPIPRSLGELSLGQSWDEVRASFPVEELPHVAPWIKALGDTVFTWKRIVDGKRVYPDYFYGEIHGGKVGLITKSWPLESSRALPDLVAEYAPGFSACALSDKSNERAMIWEDAELRASAEIQDNGAGKQCFSLCVYVLADQAAWRAAAAAWEKAHAK